jgi:hypothetical protein
VAPVALELRGGGGGNSPAPGTAPPGCVVASVERLSGAPAVRGGGLPPASAPEGRSWSGGGSFAGLLEPSARGEPGAFGLSAGSNTSARRPGDGAGSTGAADPTVGGAAAGGVYCADGRCGDGDGGRDASERPSPTSCMRRTCCSSCWLRYCSCSIAPVSCRIAASSRSRRVNISEAESWAEATPEPSVQAKASASRDAERIIGRHFRWVGDP